MIDTIIQSSIVLGQAGVKLWIIKLDSLFPYWNTVMYWVSDTEEKHAIHIANQKRKILYVLRKGIVRRVLSCELQKEPENIAIMYDEKNKPYLLDESLQFNISHSRNYLMIGISKENPIGVDIQKINRQKKWLPELLYSKRELEQYQCLDEDGKKSFFWRTFSWKEAISKAVGDGMTVNFSEIEMISDEIRENREVWIRYTAEKKILVIQEVSEELDYVCSYAILKEISTLPVDKDNIFCKTTKKR